MTKAGIDYLQGVFATCAERAKENKRIRQTRPEALAGAFALETAFRMNMDLISAIATFERFSLPDCDDGTHMDADAPERAGKGNEQ